MIPTYEMCFQEFEAGNVSHRISDCGNFCLFDYDMTVEFKNLWNDTNMWCRGIVFDNNTKEVVAVPFKKFWNVGQKPNLSISRLESKGIPRVMSKEDGSLGILFWDRYSQSWRFNTRGSFNSPQAKFATEFIQQFKDNLPQDKTKTHLFEIVYPENQIVVNYNGFRGLIYLGSRNNQTGEDCSDYEFFGKIFRTCKISDFFSFSAMQEVLKTTDKNTEGFVLLYSDGTMAKMKGDEYIRVHRLRSTKSIKNYAEVVKVNKNFFGVLDLIPDEFWNDYRDAMEAFKNAVENDFEFIKNFVQNLPMITNVGGFSLETPIEMTRREKAIYAKEKLKPELLPCFFHILDGKEDKAFAKICDNHVESKKFHFKTFLAND